MSAASPGSRDSAGSAAATSIRTRRRRGSGRELRTVILTATTELLGELGNVDALTMRAVATAAGVTAPSVYRHFPDKESLVRSVLEERFTAFAATLAAAAQEATDRGCGPLARLEGMAHAYVRAGLDGPGTYRVLFSATGAGPDGIGLAPGAEHPGADSFRSLLDAVTACLALPGDPSAAELAVELWASLHGVVDLRITKPEMPWPEPSPLVERALGPIRAAAEGGRR